jgi:ribonucleoside-diphosphate reductase alpha chain
MFYRDTVNRANPNKHLGMIYCSNLCTEIMQNLSVTTIKEEVLNGDTIVIQKQVGDFVTCNLSSINLGRAVIDDVLERLIPIQVRMLDNTIDVNDIEVLQAQATNKKYRAVGLGTFGLAHLQALKGIKWESQEAVDFNDNLYEKIAWLTINASADLSIEKGAYPAFSGSEWHTGEYFRRRGYDSQEWNLLEAKIATHGLRNGYLMAVAPNGTTSVIAGSTASIDPIFNLKYSEEKKDYKIPVVVPDLNARTRFYYKGAYFIDQKWTLRQNAARQRHIDQAQSCNLYVAPDIKAVELLDLHMTAWELKVKSTYYVRSQAVVIDDNNCEWCQG